MELSIVIPCYNEQTRIRTTFYKIFRYLIERNYQAEIIFIDDGSVDFTLQVLKKLSTKTKKFNSISTKIISYSRNKGKGFAVKQGINQSTKKLILISDADLSVPIEELSYLLNYIKDFDLVVGSRRQAGSRIIKSQSFTRTLLGKGFSYISKIVLGVKVNDFTCGFKLIKLKKAREIVNRMTIDGWGYDAEILKIASLLNYKIKEVGVIWRNDPQTKVNITRDILSSWFDLIKIYSNSKKNKYL